MAKKLINTTLKLGEGTLTTEAIGDHIKVFEEVVIYSNGVATIRYPFSLNSPPQAILPISTTQGSRVVTYSITNITRSSFRVYGFNAQTSANVGNTNTQFIVIL